MSIIKKGNIVTSEHKKINKVLAMIQEADEDQVLMIEKIIAEMQSGDSGFHKKYYKLLGNMTNTTRVN